MTPEMAKLKYGDIVNGVWLDEAKWCTPFLIPDEIQWINPITGKRQSRIYCNLDLQGPLTQAFQNVIKAGVQDQLKTFDGCYNVRPIRGRTEWSMHSWAAAIDINASENPLGGPCKLSPELVHCFESAGLTWGGRFHRIDPQHFSLGF